MIHAKDAGSVNDTFKSFLGNFMKFWNSFKYMLIFIIGLYFSFQPFFLNQLILPDNYSETWINTIIILWYGILSVGYHLFSLYTFNTMIKDPKNKDILNGIKEMFKKRKVLLVVLMSFIAVSVNLYPITIFYLSNIIGLFSANVLGSIIIFLNIMLHLLIVFIHDNHKIFWYDHIFDFFFGKKFFRLNEKR